MATAMVCGSRATTQVMSVVAGRPCSSTVAMTHACPPRRNCTSGFGIWATGAAGVWVGSDISSASGTGGRNFLRAQAGAEDGAGLIALGAVELAGDERQERRRARAAVAWPARCQGARCGENDLVR